MKYIDRLLQGAPVEWLPLSEVLVRTRGTKITASQMKVLHKEGAPIKIFAGGKTVAYISYEDLPEKDICYEPSIIVKSRGIIGFEYYDKPFSHKNEMWAYHSEDESISIKYVYYYLVRMESVFQRIGSTMQMPQISIPDTDNYKIPIPPVAVQEEVVRVLDKFTALEAELEVALSTELDCRKRQYRYYRDALLTFDLSPSDRLCHSPLFSAPFAIEWRSLGEVAEIKRGTTATKKSSNAGEYPVISGGQQPAYYIDRFNRTGLTITIAGSGAYAGFVMYWEEPIFVSDAFSIKTEETQLSLRYTYHYLLSLQSKIYQLKSGSGVPHVYPKDVARLSIPIPPLAVQERIVEMLDKFDTLVNSISEGLPCEIELRRKQYEYYRDALLSFEPLTSHL